EKGLLHFLHGADVHFVREDVALIDQADECLEKLTGLHLFDAVEEELAIHLRAGEPDLFQERNLAAIEFDFATHAKTLRFLTRLSSSLCRGPHRRVFAQPIPDTFQVLAYFVLDRRQLPRRELRAARTPLRD